MLEYDFVIVGGTYSLPWVSCAGTDTVDTGGTSGSVLASRLARSARKPSVLLLEAGESDISAADLDVTQRFKLAFKQDSKLNWNHKTTEQFGRPVDYSGGRALGGSTAINFCAFLVGSQEDYNEWARLANDHAFAWPHVKGLFGRIERYHQDIDPAFEDYVQLPSRSSGHGPLDLTYGEATSQSVHENFTAAAQVGWTHNLDLNSGNPIGFGISSATFLKGKRVTAASAYLANIPENLTIITNTVIARVDAEKLIAIGVDGEIYRARNEIISCCGAVKTPQLLMLSGIGDPDELLLHGIQPKHELRQVGKGLQDHCFSPAGVVIDTTGIDTDPELFPGQRVPSMKGWFKLETLLSSPEFKDLPPSTQAYLQRPEVPNWEIAVRARVYTDNSPQANEAIVSAIALIMNPQSRGVVSLQSSDPLAPPMIDPRFLSHPFDRKAIIEAMREMLRYFQAPIFKDRTIRRIDWPEDDSDEGILDQVKQNLASSWHPCGTVVMGRDADTACVDSDFKIFGLPKVRVVDMSTCPVLPCNHTQSTAYLIGEIAAEKMIAEYSLDVTVA